MANLHATAVPEIALNLAVALVYAALHPRVGAR
jgi:hypothetical protein